MSELTYIGGISCTRCERHNEANCVSKKCVACVVDRVPGVGCMGINECRGSTAGNLNSCKAYKAQTWDK